MWLVNCLTLATLRLLKDNKDNKDNIKRKRTMTRDEFIQRAAISMADKVVDIDGEITESEAKQIAESAAELADAIGPFAHWTLG